MYNTIFYCYVKDFLNLFYSLSKNIILIVCLSLSSGIYTGHLSCTRMFLLMIIIIMIMAVGTEVFVPYVLDTGSDLLLQIFVVRSGEKNKLFFTLLAEQLATN